MCQRGFVMSAETINIAEAKKRFSALIGQVAYGKKEILITKRGKPMARIVPAIESETHLGDAKGWLENDDPFFHVVETIVEERNNHIPRVLQVR